MIPLGQVQYELRLANGVLRIDFDLQFPVYLLQDIANNVMEIHVVLILLQ